jgi:tetratricopeptide (TPR) repeat protein
MKIFLCIILLSAAFIYGCDKMEEKKETSQTPPMNMTRPDQTQTESGSEKNSGDMMAVTLQNLAEDAEVQFQKNQSQDDKEVLIEAHLKAGNYLMFEADLPAKQKYRPALKHFRRVIELDPGNQVAAANKKQIEDIYESMGMPIPQ